MPFTNLPYVNVQTTSYALLMSDDVVDFNVGSGTTTATLPTAAGIAGKRFTIKNVDTSSVTSFVVIATTGGQTVDGRASNSFRLSPRDFVQVVSDGTNWKVVVYQETVVARVRLGTPQGTLTGVDTIIVYTQSDFDTHGAFPVSSGVFTAPANGKYWFEASVSFGANATGVRALGVYKNGLAGTLQGYISRKNGVAGGEDTYINGGIEVSLLAGETVVIITDQTSGGNLSIGTSGTSYDFCSVSKIGN